MLQALILMGGLGVAVGVCLAIASKIFYVYVDPLIEAVEAALPGANCGGCGYPGCSANAAAIVAGTAAPNSCVAAGEETALAIAELLGVKIEAREPDISRPGCTYGVAEADTKFDYDGIGDCRAAALLSGGMKVCAIGCLGLGSCVRACQFDALHMGPDGLPVVDAEKCTGCGACERVCPKHIITLSSVSRRILHEYTQSDCTTPCQRVCPAGIDIRTYIRQIAEGDYHGAVQTIKERNPFPAVIGRICPRPCEDQCRRQLVDEPVAINFLKRFAADYERSHGGPILPYKAPDTGRRLAVIGGGVEGLSAAFFAARLGHGVVVYESSDQLGGLLRTAIARNRLPASVLEEDLRSVEALGVETRTGQTLGRDMTVAGLLAEGNEAVLLATGGWDGRLAALRTAPPPPMVPGTWLLIDVMRLRSKGEGESAFNGDVVVYGGGELALAAASRCRELGAARVTVVLRGKAPESAAPAGEGIEVMTATAVDALYGSGSALTGLSLRNLDSGEISLVAAQHLVMAAGRLPELIFQSDRPGDAEADTPSENWTARSPYKAPLNAAEGGMGLFSEADVLSDFPAAIKAIAAGRRLAAAAHRLMYGGDLALPENVLTPHSVVQNVDHVEGVLPEPREIMPLCRETAPGAEVEIEQGFDEAQARREAARCLQCGLICYRHTTARVPGDAPAVAGEARPEG
ncbi:MAG TPA: RnfABCDGE type electron transport complex subunit B [Desulfobacteraceae bacterium]|nr:RnfABCDGE type electron transport complex subunit B [Deltaproteobacteria bacterium]RLB98643.1 MAG: electron transporter RnfB [Deltaproteobacteria bacterium]HDI61064.1 RnfABCDGE type electron transport complex subunit B [Desulfobacteraceae bacterium]